MIPPVRAGMTLGFGLLVTHGFGLSLVPALLPHIAASLDAGYTELGLAVASGLLSYSIGALGSGWLLERIPNRLLLLATFVVPSVALIGVSQATSGVAIAVAVALLGVNAGVSWPVSLHTLASTVHADARTAVMSGAGAGVGLGLIVNGILVQLTGSAVTWQQAVQVASVIALVPILLAFVVFRDQIQPPSGTEPARGAYRRAASSTTGKVIILAGLAGGFFGFPIVAFLSVVATDELGVDAVRSAALWWLTGTAGIVVSPLFGRLGQRTSPLFAMIVGALIFLSGLVVLAAAWNYLALAFLAVALPAFYYPMWGLAGSMANRVFETNTAVRSVALGLIGAAVGGAIGNSLAGAWFDASGTFRGPIVVIVGGMYGVAAFFVWVHRRDPTEADTATTPTAA